MVVFNTTVHEGNFGHIPNLVRFFIEHSDDIGLVSFQLQADTGRGEWHQRDQMITQQTMKKQIELGTARSLPWGIVDFGHGDCHSYMPTVVTNQRVFPVIDDRKLYGQFLAEFQHIKADRHDKFYQVALAYGKTWLRQPRLWLPAIKYASGQIKQMGRHLWLGKGKVNKLSFFMQNFMDAEGLVAERVEACSFMVMTDEGPISMCEHNAKRDDFILKPLDVEKDDGSVVHYVPIPEVPKLKKASGEN